MTMPLWVIFSLLAPAFWAGSNLIDQFLIRGRFNPTPLSYVFLQGGFYLPVMVIFLIVRPDALAAPLPVIGLLLVLSLTWIPFVWCYVGALRNEDASTAVPLFNMIPFIVLICGWLFLGETVSSAQLLAGLVIVAGSAALVWDFHARRLRARTFFMMLASCLSISLYIVVARHYLETLPWTQVYFWYAAGFTLISLAGIACHRPTRVLLRTIRSPRLYALCGAQAWLDVIASSCLTVATAQAPAAVMVSFLTSVQPLYVLIAAGLMGLIRPDIFDPLRLDRHFAWKLTCIFVILGGVWGLLASGA